MITKKDPSLEAKKEYSTPNLIVHGDVESITLGSDVGGSLDGVYTVNNEKGRVRPKHDFS